MYELRGWITLIDGTYESDFDALDPWIQQLNSLVNNAHWTTMSIGLRPLNGTYHLSMDINANQKRDEARLADEILQFVADHLPGSYGVLHDRNDEQLDPPGPNAFRVRVIRRGQIIQESDNLLSPCRPLIED
ncbi:MULTISPECIES: Imm7 family immunity protein [unclassified Micromonospora]|uniref:Imm7 family immunity protein n=1 Tax=unclassified Micromonospora TaxID=2617518 RepID=UPI003A85AB1A